MIALPQDLRAGEPPADRFVGRGLGWGCRLLTPTYIRSSDETLCDLLVEVVSTQASCFATAMRCEGPHARTSNCTLPPSNMPKTTLLLGTPRATITRSCAPNCGPTSAHAVVVMLQTFPMATITMTRMAATATAAAAAAARGTIRATTTTRSRRRRSPRATRYRRHSRTSSSSARARWWTTRRTTTSSCRLAPA